jgi:hypothetical protein
MAISPVKGSSEEKTTLYLSPVKKSSTTLPVKNSEAKTPYETKIPFHASPVKVSETKVALSFTPAKSGSEEDTTSVPVVPAESPVKRAGKSVQHLYKVIRQSTGAVGGYGHQGPIYGEITMGTFQKVIDALSLHTGFDASSSFVDIGSGLGKPNLHVALNPGVKLSYGIEVEQLRWQLSMHNLRFVMEKVPDMRKSVVYFAHQDATTINDFEPFTHVYMFDVGFPADVMISIANSFNRSKSVRALVSFKRPKKVISEYGFAVELIDQVSTKMDGSSEGHTAYIYRPKRTEVKPRRQLQLRGFLLDKEDAASPVKKANPEKGVTDRTLAELMLLEDYASWVASTGVLGAPGERLPRAVKRVVKYF